MVRERSVGGDTHSGLKIFTRETEDDTTCPQSWNNIMMESGAGTTTGRGKGGGGV